MKNSELRLASISDIHLGNRLVPVHEMIPKLDKIFPDNSKLAELDIIFFGGDVFDRLLSLPDDGVTQIKHWINRFLRRCKRHDVMVRVLEGTPSHDWGQNKLFIEINEIGQIGCDVVYQDTLCIEHIERLGIDVLYVPDEWEFETDDTWKQVTKLLADRGLSKVDFCIMHGSFEYQLPSHVQVPMHKEERYLSITRHYIFIGHIHKHLPKGRIIPNGSFDRLCHGEEEPKGYVRAVIRKDGDDEILFIPNEDAKKFVTVDCAGLDISEAIAKVEQTCETLPDGSHVRIQARRTDSIFTGLSAVREQYPLLFWSTKEIKDDVNKTDTLTKLSAKFKGVEINRENIVELLMKRIEGQCDDPAVLSRCRQRLEEVV